MNRQRHIRRRGFSLAELSVTSVLMVMLTAVLANAWTGLGQPLLQTMHRGRLALESNLAAACLARDLGGCLPGDQGVVGRKSNYVLVGRTQPGGIELWLCFDGGNSPNGVADWVAPDVVITYSVVDNTLVRSDQSTGTVFVVAKHVQSLALADLGGQVEITLTFAYRNASQTYTLVAKDP
jgi:hypothetical protein